MDGFGPLRRLLGHQSPLQVPLPAGTSLLSALRPLSLLLGHRSWLDRRQINGSLNRTPAGFYDRVWQILERTPNGIVVAGRHLPQVSARVGAVGGAGAASSLSACSGLSGAG